MKRAVFMDRDGTISEEVGYLNHQSRFRVFSYSPAAVRLLNESGWLAIVVTNQAGVARGYFPEALIGAVHEQLNLHLEGEAAHLDAVYYCPHHPTVGEPPYRLDCGCRKPKPGLILKAAKEFDIDLAQSWMIGDRYSDIEMAHNAGVNSALVLSGYGRGEWEHQHSRWQHQPDLIADDLFAAIQRILTDQAKRDLEWNGGV